MRVNTVLIIGTLLATFLILLSAVLNSRTVFQPKASPIAQTVLTSDVLIDASRAGILSEPFSPTSHDVIPDLPGNEISYITELGDQVLYSAEGVFISMQPQVLSATPSATIPALVGIDRVNFVKLHQSDLYDTALFTLIRTKTIDGKLRNLNRLVIMYPADKKNPADITKIQTMLAAPEHE